MKICFTNAVADNKDEAAELLRKKTPWYSDNGDYERLIELYRSGRSINIIDTGFSDTVIIDCDDLSEKQIKLLADEKELKRIAREMVAEKITVLPSASRVESKRKIFIKKAYKREIIDNIDTAYREIRLQFFRKDWNCM